VFRAGRGRGPWWPGGPSGPGARLRSLIKRGREGIFGEASCRLWGSGAGGAVRAALCLSGARCGPPARHGCPHARSLQRARSGRCAVCCAGGTGRGAKPARAAVGRREEGRGGLSAAEGEGGELGVRPAGGVCWAGGLCGLPAGWAPWVWQIPALGGGRGVG